MISRRWRWAWLALLIVGCVAIFLVAEELTYRSGLYRERAERHAGKEIASRKSMKVFGQFARDKRYQKDASRLLAGEALCAQKAEYHARMKRKYERAAFLPWVSVPPDPPEP